MLKQEYIDWIQNYCSERNGIVSGCCISSTTEMVRAFPELKQVKGWALLLNRGLAEHAWCETEDGEVIDPTVSQFQSSVIEYKAWQPGDTVCVGRCMNCGEYIYEAVYSLDGKRRMSCGFECDEELCKDLQVSMY
jgi:hypothetical protein